MRATYTKRGTYFTVTRPWDSPDSVEEEKRKRRGNGSTMEGRHAMKMESQEEIQMCLNCQRPKCVNCLG